MPDDGYMSTTESVEEVTVTVPWWRIRQSPETVLRVGRDKARRKGIDVNADPIVRVTLVWPQQGGAESAA